MKKKIALIQMQAVLADVETNYRHAEKSGYSCPS